VICKSNRHMNSVLQNLTIQIGNRRVGPQHPVFIIAEAGVNHNGQPELARQLVDAAFRSGADAVKFQSFVASEMISAAAPKAEYQLQTTDPTETQLEMVQRLELSPTAHQTLNDYCRDLGIQFLSTPFDRTSADLLNELEVPAFKISSGDVTDWPFLDYVARRGKPIILSTGMSYLSEVAQALKVIRDAGNHETILLHCVSNYPAAASDVNLRAMKTMADEFQVPVGFSDHTAGTNVAIAAVALGASVIEKHLTLDKNLPGPDHRASLEPEEFKALVEGIRAVESALGNGDKEPAASESDTRRVARRSLVSANPLDEGTILRSEMLSEMRPGTGISPSAIGDVLGRRLRRKLESGELLSWSDLQ